MKMSDAFELPMMVDGYSVESQPSIPEGCTREFVSDIECDNRKDAKYVAHAINNHDRLTQENAELREVLVMMLDSSEAICMPENKTVRELALELLNK